MSATKRQTGSRKSGEAVRGSELVTVQCELPSHLIGKIAALCRRQWDPHRSLEQALPDIVRAGLRALELEARLAKGELDQAHEAEKALARAEYERVRQDEAAKTARLREVRLAKEEHDRRVSANEQRSAVRRPRSAPREANRKRPDAEPVGGRV